MDRTAAVAIGAAIPVLALAVWGLTRALEPLTGYGLALCLYWFGVLLPLILWRRARRGTRVPAGVRWPGWALTVASAVLVAAVAVAALRAGWPGMALGLGAIAAALVNGTLEEAFWRGTLLPEPAPPRPAILAALALFVAWHLALLPAHGVAIAGGPLALLGGAAVLGALAMALRLRTGGWGTPALVHVGFNLFAFVELAARNG